MPNIVKVPMEAVGVDDEEGTTYPESGEEIEVTVKGKVKGIGGEGDMKYIEVIPTSYNDTPYEMKESRSEGEDLEEEGKSLIREAEKEDNQNSAKAIY